MPSTSNAVGTTLSPAPTMRAKPGSTPCVCAPSQPGARPARPPARCRAPRTQAPAQQRDAPGGLGQQLHQPPRRLLLGARADLARGQQARRRSRRGGTRRRSTAVRTCPARRSCPACRGSIGNRTGRDLGDDAERERSRRGPRTPRDEHGELEPQRQTERRPSPNVRGGTTSRDANTPAPTSRRAASTIDATTRRTRSPPRARAGAQSLSVNGRIRSVQPNGVSQSNQFVLGPESAIMRTTNATPNTRHAQARGQPARAAQLRR